MFKAYAAACGGRYAQLLAAAEASPTPVLLVTMDPEEAALSTQLYYMLVMITKAAALIRVINAGAGEGLEAWSALPPHHEPASRTRAAGLLQELLSFDVGGDTSAKLVQFDRDVHRYETSSGQPFPENVRVGVLLRGMPEGQHGSACS